MTDTLNSHTVASVATTNGTAPEAPRDSLSITDNRTGRVYTLPIRDGAIRAVDLRQISTGPDDFGLLSYDPAFMNTAACQSAITFIDGERGILLYRGYPIEQLAERSTYLETAYLLVHGELPAVAQLRDWEYQITHHTLLHENIKKFMDGFHHDAHPMGMLHATVAALSSFYPSAKRFDDRTERMQQVIRLIAKMPTIAAFAYRHTLGLPYVYPDNELSFTGNFLSMLYRMSEKAYTPNPVIERALDVLFILHADHEQNCSTAAVRGVGSSHVEGSRCLRSKRLASGGAYGRSQGLQQRATPSRGIWRWSTTPSVLSAGAAAGPCGRGRTRLYAGERCSDRCPVRRQASAKQEYLPSSGRER
jgi:citrate synthase